MDKISRAIWKASGILAAASVLDMRASKFSAGTARGRATAVAMTVVADELRDLAIKTRSDAEKKTYPLTPA